MLYIIIIIKRVCTRVRVSRGNSIYINEFIKVIVIYIYLDISDVIFIRKTEM